MGDYRNRGRGSKSIRHIVEGKTVLEYTQPQLDNGKLLGVARSHFSQKVTPLSFVRLS